MESSDSSQAQKSSEEKSARSSVNDALLANQSQSTSSSENVQSMIIRVLDDIVGRVSESDNTDEQRLPEKQPDKKGEKKSKRKRNVKKSQQKEESVPQPTKKDDEVKDDQQEAEPSTSGQTRPAQIETDEVRPEKPESVSIQLVAEGSDRAEPLLDDQYIDDDELLSRQNASPEQYGSLLDYFRDPNYWQQSAVIETEHNNVPVCEKLIVQSMPNMTPGGPKLGQQVNPGLLSVLASRSPSQVDMAEVEKQRGAFSDYGHCNELLCKIHARSRIARQLRKKSRRESKQFTLPSGYKVAYSSTNAQNRSYKFNKSKHHYQPPVQFQRSLSCSVAVLNSLSLPAKKHSKRRDSADSAKKPLFGSHKRPKLNFHQILTLIVLASLAFASQCSMVNLRFLGRLDSKSKF